MTINVRLSANKHKRVNIKLNTNDKYMIVFRRQTMFDPPGLI